MMIKLRAVIVCFKQKLRGHSFNLSQKLYCGSVVSLSFFSKQFKTIISIDTLTRIYVCNPQKLIIYALFSS